MNEITLSNNLAQIGLTESENEIFQYCMLLNDTGFHAGIINWIVGKPHKKIMITSSTTHERIFHLMYPSLKQQVTFGTGKGGYKAWGVKKFTLDFYDEIKNIAYEIDGKTHETEIGKLRDEFRDGLLYHLHGIKTIRYSNEEVENMLKKRIKKLGAEYFGINDK